jgi:hypothetical protein
METAGLPTKGTGFFLGFSEIAKSMSSGRGEKEMRAKAEEISAD